MESKRSPYLKHLYVCTHEREAGKSCCARRDGEKILERLKAYVQEKGLKGRVRVNRSGCMDLCEQGANVMVYPDHRWYSRVTPESVDRIIREELEPLAGSGPAVKAFLFDLGNVLVRFDHRLAAAKIVGDNGVSAEKLFAMLIESPLVTAHDEGRISTREFYQRVKKEVPLSIGFGQFLEVWNDIFTEDRQMTALLEKLLSRYPCYLISNTNRPHFEYLRRICPVLNQLSGFVLSYEVGRLKPHPEIYRRALDLARLPPQEIFYVDDRQDLIDAAGLLGFQTHRFTRFELLADELRSRRILPVKAR